MIASPAQKRHIKGIYFLAHLLGIYILAHSLLDVKTSSILKYGCFAFFVIEKLIGIKNAVSHPSLENLLESVFHLDISIFKTTYRKRLSFNPIFFLSSFLLTLFECLYFDNSQTAYVIYIWACVFVGYLIFYQDWIAAIDAVWVQFLVLSMMRLFVLKYAFREVAITIGCELTLIYFAFIASFDQKENIGALNLKEITIGLVLSLFFGITLPFNANKREYILKDKIFKVLGQTQGFFTFHVLFTFKSLFYDYPLLTRVGIIVYLPIFIYRLFRQFNFFTSGPYYSSLEISCNSHTKTFRQINDEILQCKIIFQHHNTNWACDQMDLLMKINPHLVFTYELHHGALVSEIKFEQHNRNNIYSVATTDLTILIFALYVYTINRQYPDLMFHFDINKFKYVPQYDLDYYLMKYPFVRFYSKQLNYDGEEVPIQFSPTFQKYKREVQNQVYGLIIYERLLKDKIKLFRYDIFCELNKIEN